MTVNYQNTLKAIQLMMEAQHLSVSALAEKCHISVTLLVGQLNHSETAPEARKKTLNNIALNGPQLAQISEVLGFSSAQQLTEEAQHTWKDVPWHIPNDNTYHHCRTGTGTTLLPKKKLYMDYCAAAKIILGDCMAHKKATFEKLTFNIMESEWLAHILGVAPTERSFPDLKIHGKLEILAVFAKNTGALYGNRSMDLDGMLALSQTLAAKQEGYVAAVVNKAARSPDAFSR